MHERAPSEKQAPGGSESQAQEEQRFAWKQLRMRLTTDAAIGPM